MSSNFQFLMPYTVKCDHIINDLCMPQFKGTSDHFHSSFSTLIFICCQWRIAVKTYILPKEILKLLLNIQLQKRKKILSSSVIFLSTKSRKLLVICFTIDYFLIFSFSLICQCFKLPLFQTLLCPRRLLLLLYFYFVLLSFALSSLSHMNSLFFQKIST